MSTKTLRKRIALATVAAVGAGVLSLVSTSVANAGQAGTLVGADGTAGATGSLNIATNNSVTGVAKNDGDNATNNSVGLIYVGDIAGNATPYAGTTQTATLISGGKLVVYTKNDQYNGGTFTVTGGTLSGYGTSAISSDGTVLSYASFGAGSATYKAATVTPNTGATSMIVRLYNRTGGASGAGNAKDGDVTDPTAGTLVGQITVTIAATSTSGVVSPAKSGIYYADNGTSTARTADTTTSVDATHKQGATVPWNQASYAVVRVKDSYGTNIAGTGGLLTATATNGAYIHLDASSGATGSASTAFLANTADQAVLTVSAPSAAPLSTVVTVSYNGVVVGTKAFTFTGPITKVTLGNALRIQKTGTPAAGAKGAAITFADAAGNVIYPLASDVAYPTSAIIADGNNPGSSTIAYSSASSSSSSYLDWTCAAGIAAHTDSVVLNYVNLDGTVAKSNAINVACAGTAYTYTAAFDKSTYAPGEVATLSVTFKDSKGNVAADDDNAMAGIASATSGQPVAAAGGTLSVTPTNSDHTALGVATYKILVGTSEGTFNTVVNYVNPATAFSSSQAAQIATLTVKSGSTSLNDVLKGIVALIASINKQIAALAKLVTKKK